MKAYVRVEVFLASVLLLVSSMLRPLYSQEKAPPPPPNTHRIGGWVGPRTGMKGANKIKLCPLLGLQLRLRPFNFTIPALYVHT
jgi:hypothetical protein